MGNWTSLEGMCCEMDNSRDKLLRAFCPSAGSKGFFYLLGKPERSRTMGLPHLSSDFFKCI